MVDCRKLKQPVASCRAFRNSDFAELPLSQFERVRQLVAATAFETIVVRVA